MAEHERLKVCSDDATLLLGQGAVSHGAFSQGVASVSNNVG